MLELHIPNARLVYSHIPSTIPSQHRCQRHRHLRPREVHPQTFPRAQPEPEVGHAPFPYCLHPFRISVTKQPPIGIKSVRLGEEEGVSARAEGAHRYRRAGRNGVGSIMEGFGRGDALVAARQTKRKARCFEDHSREERKAEERGQGRRSGKGVEFGAQTVKK